MSPCNHVQGSVLSRTQHPKAVKGKITHMTGIRPSAHPGLREQALPTAQPPRDARGGLVDLWACWGSAPTPASGFSLLFSPPLLLQVAQPLRPPPFSGIFLPPGPQRRWAFSEGTQCALLRCHGKKRQGKAGQDRLPGKSTFWSLTQLQGSDPAGATGAAPAAADPVIGQRPVLRALGAQRPEPPDFTQMGGGANTPATREAGEWR